MTPSRTLILFPCYQWDDFPRSLADRQAAGLLAGWTVLWHPHLLVAANQLPTWCRADQPPDQWENVLAILPVASENRFPDQLRDKISAGGGKHIPCAPSRHEMLTQLKADGIVPDTTCDASADLLNDFFALGYCYLQVQLMTRQLRYATHLDQAIFEDHLLQAAKAFQEGNLDLAKQMLQSCFDQLGQERDHFYSHDTHIIEIILVAATTLGAKLDLELARPQPLNLLINGELLQKLAAVNPAALERIKERIKSGTLCLIGGSYSDLAHPLLDADSIRRDLTRGLATFETLVAHKPTVFGRYKDGITPHFPTILRRFGYQGALLFAWESGSYPEATQVKSAWEAPDGTAIDTLSGSVIDGANSDSFLGMGTRLGQSLDHDHISTMIIAHWPGHRSEFIQDHARTTDHTPALGKWMGAERYFEITAHPYHQERLTSSEFKPNFLTQSVGANETDPISSLIRYHQLTARLRQLQTVSVLSEQLKSLYSVKPAAIENEAEAGSSSKPKPTKPILDSSLAQLWNSIDSEVQKYSGISQESSKTLGDTLTHLSNQKLQELAALISKGAKNTAPGVMVFNPNFAARRMQWLDNQAINCNGNEAALYAQLSGNKGVRTIVDLPPCGYLWSSQTAASSAPRGKLPRSAALASGDGTLGNEFMEVQLDRNTGHLKSLHVPKTRGNRLSVQLSMYDPRGGGTAERPYAVMKADKLVLSESSSVYGEIVASGGLWFEKQKAAEYQISYRLWRGSRILQLLIQLDLKRTLLEEPWSSYVALRTAWANESAVLFGVLGGNRQTLPRGKLISPNFVEIDEVDYRTTLCFGGIPYHRRNNDRFLDSLLMVRGETNQEYQVSVGVDLPEPTIASESSLAAPLKIEGVPGPPVSGPSTWFFAVEPQTVLVQPLTSLFDESGSLCGVRLMVRECLSKLTATRIRCVRDVHLAYRADEAGNSLGSLTVEKDCVLITLTSNEQAVVDIIWQTPSSVKA
jgi:alpha-mannosidase